MSERTGSSVDYVFSSDFTRLTPTENLLTRDRLLTKIESSPDRYLIGIPRATGLPHDLTHPQGSSTSVLCPLSLMTDRTPERTLPQRFLILEDGLKADEIIRNGPKVYDSS